MTVFWSPTDAVLDFVQRVRTGLRLREACRYTSWSIDGEAHAARVQAEVERARQVAQTRFVKESTGRDALPEGFGASRPDRSEI